MPKRSNPAAALPRRATVLVALLAALLGLALSGGRAARAEDWALHGHDLGGQRFSPLKQVDRTTVTGLQAAWTVHTGIKATFQATPIVVDGVMFVSLPGSHVLALDARSGARKWRYEHTLRWQRLCCGPANRGVAVAGGKVYVGTVDGRLIALDAASGATLWDVSVATYEGAREETAQLSRDDPLGKVGDVGATGVGIAMAPMVYAGKVFIGINGVGYGLHPDAGLSVVGVSGKYGQSGFLAAFDAESGERLWQFDVTQQGWEGHFAEETDYGLPLNRDIAAERAAFANHADSWRYGGGSIWATPTIDPQRGWLAFGSGNPSPQMADASRPGDNLHTSSLIVLDIETGRRIWHYQQVPHDRWGYDVASPAVMFDLRTGSGTTPAIAHASKMGWVFVHERASGRLLLRSQAFVPQMNLFSPPAPDPGVLVAPGIAGGCNWSPSAVDAAQQLMFVAALHLPTRYIANSATREDGSLMTYASTQEGKERSGTLSAIDLQTGAIRWQVRTEEPLLGGVLATAGGLVFSGIGGQRLGAFDSSDGSLLWSARLDAGVNAPPITYSIDGTQYIAVAAGGNSLFGFPTGDTIAVFALPRPGQAPRP
jgi:PQQ-dependent dehydrogenase (methanol/ethanol family)